MKKHRLIVAQWLKNIGDEFKTPLVLEDDGHCIIPCDGSWSCVVEIPDDVEAPSVYIYLPLIEMPNQPVDQNNLMRAALSINLFGLFSGGAHIGLDARSDYLALSFSSLIESLSEIDFRQLLAKMLEVSPEIRYQLNQIAGQSTY